MLEFSSRTHLPILPVDLNDVVRPHNSSLVILCCHFGPARVVAQVQPVTTEWDWETRIDDEEEGEEMKGGGGGRRGRRGRGRKRRRGRGGGGRGGEGGGGGGGGGGGRRRGRRREWVSDHANLNLQSASPQHMAKYEYV